MKVSSPAFAGAVPVWRAIYLAWKDLQQAEYDEAEMETCGYMVRPEYRERGITGWGLFNMSREAGYRRATDELRAWWDEHPRTTLAEFEKMWDEGGNG